MSNLVKNTISRIVVERGGAKSDYALKQTWMTTKEASTCLRISPQTLLNEGTMRRIIPYKLGRRNRYLKEELDQIIMKKL